MYIYRLGPNSRIELPTSAMTTFLYPTWDYENRGSVNGVPVPQDDKEIWKKLVTYVESKASSTAPNKTVAGRLLLSFLEHEMQKDNFISIKHYMKLDPNDKRLAEIKFSVTSGGQPINGTAVAPFVVPKDDNDNYPINAGAFYNFRIRGRTFNGKAMGRGTGNKIKFDQSSITMLIGTGNYQRKVDDCDVLKLKDRDGNSPFKKDPADGNIVVPLTDIDIVQNEILRPYFKFMRFVDECFNLQPSDCHNEDRMVLLLEQLGRLFVDSKLDITGNPWRRVQMKSSEADKVPAPKPKQKGKKLPKPEKEYDLKDIDRERIALDARLWTKREYGNQFKRTDPSVYDLFEALQIPKNFNLEAALTELIRRLTARKLQVAHKWEPSIYTFYGRKLGRTRTDIWESALVHCLRGSTPQDYIRAIVNHIFLNPSVQQGRQRYDANDIFASGARHDFKSSHYESFDQELAENFATHMRANQDSNKFLTILNLPWPQTKQHLRKQPERNRYYPEAFVEARFPEIFYVDLKHEHEACHRLRKVAYALSLSREKGLPVISRRQVVAPDAFHTDYNTLPLPRIVSSDRNTGVYNGPSPANTQPEDKRDYWSGHNPSLIKEYGRDAHRSQSTPEVFVEPVSKHPLYPSQIKEVF